MLTFILKYIWVAILAGIYIGWSIASIKDIIETKRIYKDYFEFDALDKSSMAWIITSIGIIFGASFIYCLLGGAE